MNIDEKKKYFLGYWEAIILKLDIVVAEVTV